MMEKRVKIITDAGADLPSDKILREKYSIEPIFQIPLAVQFGDTEYITGKNIDSNKFKELVNENEICPKTSILSGETKIRYQKAIDEGSDVLGIHLGKNLSGMFNAVNLIANKNDRVWVFDTGTVSMAEGFMAIRAQQLADQGKSLEEIYGEMKKMKRKVDLRVIARNIPFIKSSGRVSDLKMLFVEKLHIVPTLRIDNNKVKNAATPRSIEKALNWMVYFARKKRPLEQVAILDLDDEQNANRLHERLVNDLKISEKIIYRGALGPVTGTHGGPGTLAMATVMAR